MEEIMNNLETMIGYLKQILELVKDLLGTLKSEDETEDAGDAE